ncbi:hypothetical protein BH09PSE3_BH09PSE3_04150 [soil metagenome]
MNFRGVPDQAARVPAQPVMSSKTLRLRLYLLQLLMDVVAISIAVAFARTFLPVDNAAYSTNNVLPIACALLYSTLAFSFRAYSVGSLKSVVYSLKRSLLALGSTAIALQGISLLATGAPVSRLACVAGLVASGALITVNRIVLVDFVRRFWSERLTAEIFGDYVLYKPEPTNRKTARQHA